MMETPSAVKLPAPSSTFLERQKKRFAATEPLLAGAPRSDSAVTKQTLEPIDGNTTRYIVTPELRDVIDIGCTIYSIT